MPPRTDPHQPPFSASQVETSSSSSTTNPTFADFAETKKQLQIRPSLQVYPPNWTRPPPDSPIDVTRGSGPHRADNGDDDDLFDEDDEYERDELDDEFENAYARTQLQTATRGRFSYVRANANSRSPLRVQHTQSMLPFSSVNTTSINGAAVATGSVINLNAAAKDVMNGMRRSPASDNQITISTGSGGGDGPFRGYEANSNSRRPTSLPSAQGEKKPWDYF